MNKDMVLKYVDERRIVLQGAIDYANSKGKGDILKSFESAIIELDELERQIKSGEFE